MMQFNRWFKELYSRFVSNHVVSNLVVISAAVGTFAVMMLLLFPGAVKAVTDPFTVTVTIGGSSTPFAMPTGDVLHYMAASGCSDSNNGTSPATPWCSPAHAMHCGDVIIAAPGNYGQIANGNQAASQAFGTVTNCPSTTGGIDGAGGINFAVMLCGAADLSSTSGCNILSTNNAIWGIAVDTNNWAVEGWTITANNPFKGGIAANGFNSKTVPLHHIALVNNVTYNVGIGIAALDNASNFSPTIGVDYIAFVGNIAQNAEQDTVCTAATVMVGPQNFNTTLGTHWFMYSGFSYYEPNNGCPFDQEDFMYDTFDEYNPTGSAVMLNNMGWSAWRAGLHMFTQGIGNPANVIFQIYNNTMFNDGQANAGFGGLSAIDNQPTTTNVPVTNLFNNISVATLGSSCSVTVGFPTAGSSRNVSIGATGNENVLFSIPGNNNGECLFQGQPAGTNFGVNPGFHNTTDLLNNRTTSAPNCAGFINTTACMGWNAITQTLTIPSGSTCPGGFTCTTLGSSGLPAIYDLMPTCAQCTGKGYQLPSTTCVSSGTVFTLYPNWLKGIVYLHWTGTAVVQNHDLATLPCGL